MSVYARISRCSSQIFALSERDVISLTISVAFGKTKVNDENAILIVLLPTYQEVIRLNVSVDDPFLMHLLYSLDHLNSNLKNCFKVKLPSAFLEEIF